MSSKAITPDIKDQAPDPGGISASVPEVAPSRLREDDQQIPRTLGMSGAVLVLFSSIALGASMSGRGLAGIAVNPGWAMVLLVLGLCGLLYHAAFDRDVMFRRLYQIFAMALLLVGGGICLIKYPSAIGDLLRYGGPLMLLSLLFFLAGFRNETDTQFRSMLENVVGGAGVLLTAIGLVGGNIKGEFLLPYGLVLSILGLLYLTAFVASRGTSNDIAYYAAVGMFLLGLLVVLIPVVVAFARPRGAEYFTAYGVILVVLGVGYMTAGGGLAADFPLLVQMRRDLGALFFSPVTYLVWLSFAFAWLVAWWIFVDELGETRRTLYEPIVRSYLFALFPVIMIIFASPLLTMSSFSEEHRSGTLEVLLTAPVTEGNVVLSKFFSSLAIYMLMWVPAGLYLLAIPLMGGSSFDYQPLLSFFVAVFISGAGFVSMGVFFSSLTRNMLVAAVLSVTMMMLLTAIYFPAHMGLSEKWTTPLRHMSYLDLYFDSLEGKLTPRLLLFPVSLTVLFLFLTLKVLESRKWR